jgi:hypothetical protein
MDTGKAMDSLGCRHCIISDTMKLINQPVNGDKQKLKEFVDNVITAFEPINPKEHDLSPEYV